MAMIEQPQGDNPGEQDEYRPQLINDKGDVENKKLENQTQRLAGLGEIVYLLEEINEDIDGGKGGGHSAEDSEKLGQDVAV